MAVALAFAGGVYLNGGLGAWEFPLAAAMVACAYRGLASYRAIGVGWLLHTGSDVLHHSIGRPMIGLFPTSSAECAVTDLFLAAWFFAGAPSVFDRFRRPRGGPAGNGSDVGVMCDA